MVIYKMVPQECPGCENRFYSEDEGAYIEYKSEIYCDDCVVSVEDNDEGYSYVLKRRCSAN